MCANLSIININKLGNARKAADHSFLFIKILQRVFNKIGDSALAGFRIFRVKEQIFMQNCSEQTVKFASV